MEVISSARVSRVRQLLETYDNNLVLTSLPLPHLNMLCSVMSQITTQCAYILFKNYMTRLHVVKGMNELFVSQPRAHNTSFAREITLTLIFFLGLVG
jgi:hypothetical protein